MSDTLRDQLLGLGFKSAPSPNANPTHGLQRVRMATVASQDPAAIGRARAGDRSGRMPLQRPTAMASANPMAGPSVGMTASPA